MNSTKPATTSERRNAAPQSPPVAPAIIAKDAVMAQLSAGDQAVLEHVLSAHEPHIDHPELHRRGAERKLFGVEARLPVTGAARFPRPVPVIDEQAIAGSRVPTLRTEQEQRLFLRLNYARMQIGRIIEACAGKSLGVSEARLLVAWGHWELDMRARIVELNLPLVLAMAKRTRLTGVDYNEMISEGNMALLRSVNKFDCGRGFKFSTYACRAILKSFSRVAMRTSRYRGTFPVEYDPSIEKSDHLDRKRDDVEANCVDDLKNILSQNAASLTAVEETVIRQRFALDASDSEVPVPKTLEQVGEVIGVTKERVRQIQNKALKKIRVALEETLAA